MLHLIQRFLIRQNKLAEALAEQTVVLESLVNEVEALRAERCVYARANARACLRACLRVNLLHSFATLPTN